MSIPEDERPAMEPPPMARPAPRQRKRQARKPRYLSKQSNVHHPSTYALDAAGLVSELGGREATFEGALPVVRSAIRSAQEELGCCVHKPAVHALVFGLLLRSYRAGADGEEDGGRLQQAAALHLGFVSEFDLARDLGRELRRALDESAESATAASSMLAHLSSADSGLVERALGLAGAEVEDAREPDHDVQGGTNAALTRLNLARASERAALLLEDWPLYLRRQASFRRTGAVSLLGYLDAFQVAMAASTGRHLDQGRQIALEVVGLVIDSALTNAEASAVAVAMASSGRFTHLRRSLRSLVPESTSEAAVVAALNRTTFAREDSFAQTLRRVLAAVAVHPERALTRLLCDGARHEAHAEVVGRLLREAPGLSSLREPNSAAALLIKVLRRVFDEVLDGGIPMEGGGVLKLSGCLAGGAGAPCSAPEVLSSFLCAWEGSTSEPEPAWFRVLGSLVELAVKGGRPIGTEDLHRLCGVVAEFWDARTLSAADADRLASMVETAEALESLYSVCGAGLPLQSDMEPLEPHREVLSSLTVRPGGLGLLGALRLLDVACSELGPVEEGAKDSLAVKAFGAIFGAEGGGGSALMRKLLKTDSVAGKSSLEAAARALALDLGGHYADGLVGVAGRIWGLAWRELASWVDGSTLRQVKSCLAEVLSGCLPWCAVPEMARFCRLLYPMALSRKLAGSPVAPQAFLFSLLRVLAAGNADVAASLARSVGGAEELASDVLKVDLIETAAVALRRERDPLRLHRLASLLRLACVEAARSGSQPWRASLLGWHSCRVLGDCCRDLAGGAPRALTNALLEVVHSIADPHFCSTTSQSAQTPGGGFWGPWELAVSSMMRGHLGGTSDLESVRDVALGGRDPSAIEPLPLVARKLVAAGMLAGTPAEEAAEEASRPAEEEAVVVEEEEAVEGNVAPAAAAAETATGLSYPKSLMLEVLDSLVSHSPARLPLPEGCSLPACLAPTDAP